MLREPAPGPARPGVKFPAGVLPRLPEKIQLAFEVCVQDGAPDAMLPQATGQPRNPARRLAGLGHGGVDEQDVGDGSVSFTSAKSCFLAGGFYLLAGDR